MTKKTNLLKLLQTFSIDVVIGAIAMGMLAVRWNHSKLPGIWWLILSLAVWIIYTSDHLIDSLKKKQQALNYRHRIHFLLKNYLITITIFLIVITILLSVIYLEKKIVIAGVILGSIVMLYLLAVLIGQKYFTYFFKEIFIATIYVAGIWLAPLIESSNIEILFTVAIITIFILLAISEGLIVSAYEILLDVTDAQHSFSTRFGVKTTRKIAGFLLSIAILLSLIFIFMANTKLQIMCFIITLLMSILLCILLIFTHFFSKNNRYRLLGELLFWMPAIIWFI